jgi:hypothetical protein
MPVDFQQSLIFAGRQNKGNSEGAAHFLELIFLARRLIKKKTLN